MEPITVRDAAKDAGMDINDNAVNLIIDLMSRTREDQMPIDMALDAIDAGLSDDEYILKHLIMEAEGIASGVNRHTILSHDVREAIKGDRNLYDFFGPHMAEAGREQASDDGARRANTRLRAMASLIIRNTRGAPSVSELNILLAEIEDILDKVSFDLVN